MPEPSNSRSISRARSLRRRGTDAERVLWSAIKDRKIEGAKFRRQHPIPPYTVDFYCLESRLVIEVDGGQHADSVGDEERDAFMARRGERVLRFWNNDVMRNLEGVVATIHRVLASPSP